MSAVPHDEHRDAPPMLVAAIELLKAGLWPIPIVPPDFQDDAPGKRPHPALGKGWGHIVHTEESLRAFYAKHPKASLGIKLGKAGGVVDIEIDDPETGEATLEALFGGEEVETMGWDSHRGRHMLFRWDDRLGMVGKATFESDPRFPGVGLRFGCDDPEVDAQVQSVCPPSRTTYRNADGTVGIGPAREWNGVETIARLPSSFFRRLAKTLNASPTKPPAAPPTTIPFTTMPGQPSPVERAKLYLQKVEPAVSGNSGHNKAFYAAVKVCCGFDLPEDHAYAALWDWNQTCQPAWSEKELRHKIADAYKAEPRRGWLLNEERPERSRDATYATKATKDPSKVASVALVAGGDDVEDLPVEARKWPDPPSEAAWRGPAGAFARAVTPFTEADPVGILVQTLVGWGNIINRMVYYEVNATRHYLNLFCCTAGPTAAGRKGTAWDVVKLALDHCDPDHALNAMSGGLSSGEGLIWAIRDPIIKTEPLKEHGRVVGYQDVIADPGVKDKRLLVIETELGGTLKVLTREGNTLSALVRQAWDNGMLRTMTKNNAARATDAHISIIGHITETEVNKYLSANDAANGFANRFIWVAVRQVNYLPRGAAIPAGVVRPFLDQLREAMKYASSEPARIERDAEAEELWETVYKPLCKGRPGLLGAILGRAAPQIMRLACIYALMEMSPVVKKVHLEAALALWKYCEDSAAFIFGEAMGDPDADKLLSALRAAPEGLTQKEIVHNVFQRHKTREQVVSCLGRLLEVARIHSVKESTGGRPATRWFAGPDPATKAI